MTGVFFKNVDGTEGKYTGEGVGGIPHGIGVITFKDGGVYKGDMKNGTVKAPGPSLTVATSSAPLRTARNTVRALYTNGDVYVGAFENNNMRGQGTWTYA